MHTYKYTQIHTYIHTYIHIGFIEIIPAYFQTVVITKNKATHIAVDFMLVTRRNHRNE